MKADPSAHDQFIVSHGRNGAVGVFNANGPLVLRRGTRVLVQTARGVEVGAVLGPASIGQARLLGGGTFGTLLGVMTPEDETRASANRTVENDLFAAARQEVEHAGLTLEILDVELLFDGRLAVLQFVGNIADTDAFAETLQARFGLTIRLENLAVPASAAEPHHGCDKPDCGRQAGGSCTTCGDGTGGGCSTCGSSKVDLREYFGHLRAKMESRIPLT